MKFIRYAFWLILIPGGLLYFAAKMTNFLLDERSGAREDREREKHMADLQAVTDRVDALNKKAHLDRRLTLANACVAQALRAIDEDLESTPTLLVIVGYRGCGPHCDTDAIATRLVDDYYLEGLRVMLIRTVDDGTMHSPAGVSTVVLPQCASLASDYGDDFFLRRASGELSSSGERHEHGNRDPNAPFDPEPLVRAAFGITTPK